MFASNPLRKNHFTRNLITTNTVIVRHLALLIGMWLVAKEPSKRDERGLSQSAETAVLIGGAVIIAAIVIGIITTFVKTKLASL